MKFTNEKEFEEYIKGKHVKVHGSKSAPALPSPPPAETSGKGKGSKYRNQKITVDGETFDSKGEYQRWCELKMMERAGKIGKLERQVTFDLAPAVILDGRKRPPLRFTADYQYYENGERVVEDFKNPATADETAFKIRRHLMKSALRIEVKVVGG